jgi:hypothetical protein
VQKSAGLGEPVPRVTIRPILIQDYSRAFCRPLVKR